MLKRSIVGLSLLATPALACDPGHVCGAASSYGVGMQCSHIVVTPDNPSDSPIIFGILFGELREVALTGVLSTAKRLDVQVGTPMKSPNVCQGGDAYSIVNVIQIQ